MFHTGATNHELQTLKTRQNTVNKQTYTKRLSKKNKSLILLKKKLELKRWISVPHYSKAHNLCVSGHFQEHISSRAMWASNMKLFQNFWVSIEGTLENVSYLFCCEREWKQQFWNIMTKKYFFYLFIPLN